MKHGLAIALLCAGVLACRSTLPPPESGVAPPSGANLEVIVRNDYASELEVVLVLDGSTHRLGVVAGRVEGRFTVPSARFRAPGRVAILARALVGSAQYRSPPVLVPDGVRLLVELGSELRFSSVRAQR